MNATTLTPFWTQQEIDRLDEFLTREGGPQNTMDAAMIDGYICALVSGPRLIAPSEALRWIWDTEKGQDEPVFESTEEAQDIMGLIMRQWQAVSGILMQAPDVYEPQFYERVTEGGTISIIGEWCMGYYKGIDVDMQSWTPLLVSKPELFSGILQYGTQEGLEALKRKQFSAQEHEAIAETLGDKARAIHAHFLATRSAAAASGRFSSPVVRRESIRREGPKIGRNDPCPCGSGQKYKKCHGSD